MHKPNRNSIFWCFDYGCSKNLQQNFLPEWIPKFIVFSSFSLMLVEVVYTDEAKATGITVITDTPTPSNENGKEEEYVDIDAI